MFNDFIVIKNFHKNSRALRSVYDQNFSPSKIAHNNRFVWDYWYLENKYVHFRTPAMSYFPEPLISKFNSDLVSWGQKMLGCNSITAPWLSYYLDGCKQDLHGDIPHGPWAYVYSLTVDPKLFLGGETLILKEPILNYWKNLDTFDGLNQENIFNIIKPTFNQLLIFDGRIPHGVSMVQGPRDPKLARVVLHGWFTEPSPYIDGPLSAKNAAKVLNKHLGPCFEEIDQSKLNISGVMSLRLDVSKNGALLNLKPLASSLKCHEIDSTTLNRSMLATVKTHFRNIKFEKNKSSSQITLPLVFGKIK